MLSLELTCGRWLESWRSLPGNHLETNGSLRILSHHRKGNSDWTIAADSFDASTMRFFSLLLGFVVIFFRFMTLTGLQSYEVYETAFVIDYSTFLASFYHVANYILYVSLDLKRLRISANNLLNVHFFYCVEKPSKVLWIKDEKKLCLAT